MKGVILKPNSGGRIIAAAFLAVALSACSGASTSVPSSHAVQTASHGRHSRAFNPDPTSPCGTCGCSQDGDNAGTLIPVGDEGPCGGGGIGPMNGTSPGDAPIIDNGPPDLPVPPQIACDPNSTDPSCSVAVRFGFPSGTCRQSDLQESMGVGDSIGPVNKDGNPSVRSVVDINQVNAATNLQIVNNQTVVGQWVSVGWIYLDDQGGLWFQKDPQAQWSLGLNFNLNQYFGLTLVPPPGQNPYYIASHPTTAPGGKDLQVTKCFSKGRGLVPGALSNSSGPKVT